MALIEQQNRAARKSRARPRSKLPPRWMRGLLRIHWLLLLVLTLSFFPKVSSGQENSAGEYELKAAMLYNLTRFVEWPAAAYPDPQTPTVLCIFGRDPFGSALSTTVSEQMASGGRTVEIRHVQNVMGIRGCHVVYISSSERKSIDQTFSNLKDSSVLTVGEMSQFAARGGMIQFSLEEKQVRFEINLDAASRAGLKLSSRLLVLARIVKDQNRNSGREGSALRLQEFEIANSRPPAGYGSPAENFPERAICNDVSDERRRSR